MSHKSIYTKSVALAAHPRARAVCTLTELGTKRWSIVDGARTLTIGHYTARQAWRELAVKARANFSSG